MTVSIANDLKHLKVKHAMTLHPFTVGPNTTVDKVKEIFEKEKIHHLPIVDDQGILLGITSYSDVMLLMDWATRFNQESALKKSALLLKSQIANDISAKKVVAILPDDTLQNCYEIFKQKEIRALPVITAEGFLVGIITPLDILILIFQNKKL